MSWVANSRMYSVSPQAAEAWKELFAWLARKSGFDIEIIDHKFPNTRLDGRIKALLTVSFA
jgi:hypothetical protein